MEQILQKNKKNLSYLEHYKKTTNGIQFRNVDEKHSLIQIDNEKKGIISQINTIDDEQDTEIIYFLGQELTDSNQTIEQYKENIKVESEE